MRLKKLRAILYFYRSLAGATVTITLALWYELYHAGKDADAALISVLVIFKMLSDILVWYFAKTIMARRLYYYYNLHISRSRLWLSTFFIDLSIFIAGLWIIY